MSTPILLRAGSRLMRHWRLFLILPLLSAAAAGVLGWLRGPEYTTTARLRPESGDGGAARLGGIAAQFGVAVIGSPQGESIDFYAELLRSSELLRAAAVAEYTVGGRTASLLDLWQVPGADLEERVRNGRDRLSRSIAVGTDPKAQLASLRVTARSPELAVQISHRLLELVDDFNQRTRQSRARAEREFIERRIAEASAELRAAEAELQQFMARNRRFRESPQLLIEAERLQRRVEQKQQVFVSLSEAFERARIDEVRDTPLFTMIDRPESSLRRIGSIGSAVALGLLFGLLAAAAVIVLRDYILRLQREHPAASSEIVAVRDHAMRRILRRTRPPVAR